VLVAIVALLAEELAGRRAGVIAGVIAAIDPNLWTWDGRVLSEPLAALFLTTSVLLAYQASRDPTSRRFVIAVAFGVLAGLTRAELMLVVPAIVIVVGRQLWVVASRRQFVIAVEVAVAASGLLVLPWAAWNTARYGRPVLI
jgi:4-amino-4-deoxy-L-arabinose transferase-like glycosyltransferase